MTDPSCSSSEPSKPAREDGTAPEKSDSHGISFDLPAEPEASRSSSLSRRSASPYQSPMRHHQRTPSRSKGVKETLDAHSHYGSGDDDGGAVHRINQYTIKQEIGRGSFGSVHLAVDQFGNEFAVKEFSKSRLRKRAKSNLLRRPQPRRPGQLGDGFSFANSIHRLSSSAQEGDNNALHLIKEEIAIMKKLNHNNLVALIEVLDDPQEDSLYMVLEICKKGVAMKVGLDERAEPYDDETCRCWFRDMILGIEYLHAQGIIHRDIKPDNCLITNDDVLKIVDFGVSEMFEKTSEMATAKSAGSPAFMPPELCVAKHGQVSGRAADIWSMGVTLYCLRYGHIPFEKSSMIELYDSIRTEEYPLDGETDSNFKDLMQKLLDKNPDTRITMEQLRDHPWVTKNGSDTLLSAEDNCADIVELPTEQEMNHAITGNMRNLMAVVKAAKHFKTAMSHKRGVLSFFDRDAKVVAPPDSIEPASSPKSPGQKIADGLLSIGGQLRTLSGSLVDSANADDDRGEESATSSAPLRETEAIRKQQEEARSHRAGISADTELHRHNTQNNDSPGDRSQINMEDHAKGHAHDPLEDRLFLNIGSDPEKTEAPAEDEEPVVSESPSAVEKNIYEEAYREEMDRILSQRGQAASMFMNRRVDHRDDIRLHSNICDAGKYVMKSAADRLTAIQTKGSAAGDAGRAAARSAMDKLSDTDWRGASDAGKQGVKTVASEGYESSRSAAQSAAEHIGPKAGKAAGKFADLVYRTQGKSDKDSTDGASDESKSPSAPDTKAKGLAGLLSGGKTNN